MSNKERSNYIHSVDAGLIRFNRRTKNVEILIIKREKAPYEGQWALPGIVINGDIPDTSIEMALSRLLHSSKVGLEPKYMEQVETVGNGTRDPRCWSSSTFYLALIDDTYVIEGEKKFVNLNDVAGDKFPLAFDHNLLVRKIRDRLLSKSLYSSLPLLTLPDLFTTTDAIEVFSSVLDRPVIKTSMRQRLLKMAESGYVTETQEKVKPAMGRPQSLYQNLKRTEIYLFDRCFEQ